MEENNERDRTTAQAIRVKRFEPLALQKRWMKDLSKAVAFLESLDLAHGDLCPDNVLLDRKYIKLAEFGSAAPIGSKVQDFTAPYGRYLDEKPPGEQEELGYYGPRTEQFALGSLYDLISYEFEVYSDHLFGDTVNAYKHLDRVENLLYRMVFPVLNGEPVIDSIIKKCWYGGFETIAQMATEMERLLQDGSETLVEKTRIDRASSEELMRLRTVCEDLAHHGVQEALGLQDPQKIGR